MGVDDPYRRPVYTVGGMPAYGFTEPARYIEGNVPAMSNVKAENVLYERQGWNDPSQVVMTAPGWSNPPFMGIGSTSVTMAPWMQGKGGQRIIRGYMRRDTIYPIGDPNTTADLMSSNARLFFMYNPDHIQRSYQSFDQASQALFPNNDISDLPPLSWTIIQFSLFFDRQEEVASLENHPGVLIDLATFDLLAQGFSPGSVQPTEALKNLQEKVDAAAKAAGVNTSASGKSAGLTGANVPAGIDSSSLLIDPTNIVVVVFSPNLAYRGTIMSADAVFEKFSHRMTPTRMELSVTMRLYQLGQEPKITKGNGADVKSAKASNEAVGAVTPTTVTTKEEADRRNQTGRNIAMGWCDYWLPGHKTPMGIPYTHNVSLRCDNVDSDQLNYSDTETDKFPHAMDCSSFVSRGLNQAKWCQALGMSACDNSFKIKEHADALSNGQVDPYSTVWRFMPCTDTIVKMIQGMWVPGCILGRDSNGGHVAWIRAVSGSDSYGRPDRVTVLGHGGPKDGDPPNEREYSRSEIIDMYEWMALPQPTTVSS